MNVQQPKENEIVLLSGLASGNLQADFDVSQVSDIVLNQLFISDNVSVIRRA